MERLAESLEDRFEFEVYGFRAGHHHCKRSLARPLEATAHRRVDVNNIARGKGLGDCTRRARTNGGEIDHAFDLLAFDHAAVVERCALHDLGIGQAQEDRFRLARDLRGGAGALCALFFQSRDHFLADVIDDDFVAVVQQSRGHQTAHATDADESESLLFHAMPLAGFMQAMLTGRVAFSIPSADITE